MRERRFEAALRRHDRRRRSLLLSGGELYGQPLAGVTESGGVVRMAGEEVLDLTSYDYLALSGEPAVIEAAIRATEELGTGSTGVRLLSGTRRLHLELERAIARFVGQEASLTVGSGCAANRALIATLVRHGFHVFSDADNHASIHSACAEYPKRYTRFAHADLDDLVRRLEATCSSDRLIVSDAVFSTTGEIAPLPALLEIAQTHGCQLAIDEAHSLGTLGAGGRGIAEHYGVDPRSFIHVGTLSKAIPSTGGFIAWGAREVDFLRFSAEPYVFSAALTPASAATALAALRVMSETPALFEKLRENSRLLRRYLHPARTREVDFPACAVGGGPEESVWAASRACLEAGVLVLPMAYPAVSRGQAVLRVVVTTGHTPAQIELGAAVISESLRRAA